MARCAWLFLVGCLLCALPLRSGTRESWSEDYAAIKKEFVPKLAAFAEWCGSVRLNLERDRACEAVLHFDANHEGARKALKHVQQRDGTWVVPEKRPESKNQGNAMKECLKRRAELVAGWRDAIVALEGRYRTVLSPAERESLYADLLLVDPDDAGSRAVVGEVKRDEEWVLAETVTAKERRAFLKETIRKATAEAPEPTPTEFKPLEQTLGIPWSAHIQVPGVRVLSSGSPDEARRIARMCSATAEVFRTLTGAEIGLPDGFTVYLMTAEDMRDKFLASWPGWSDEERARMKSWAGSGVPGDVHIARWDADEPRRLDGSVRHVLGLLTLLNFQYDHQRCAWAWEGLGLYLTRELVGTRYTWYSTGPSTGDPESKELLGKLMMSDVNWMNECFQRAKRNKSVKAAALCERKIDQFGVDDVLTSYALAAYLVEGQGQHLRAVLTGIGTEGAAKSLSGVLQMDLDQLDRRLLRWLGERK